MRRKNWRITVILPARTLSKAHKINTMLTLATQNTQTKSFYLHENGIGP